jgi:uncharacterized protein (TIGR03085 family)
MDRVSAQRYLCHSYSLPGLALQLLPGWLRLSAPIASGPPPYSPFNILDPVANMGEMFIHHEDVRRAQTGWEPRQLDDATVRGLGRGLPIMTRLTLANAPARVSLRTPDGKTLATVGRGPELTVTREPQELLLFISCNDAVRPQFDGDAALVDAVRAARRGL